MTIETAYDVDQVLYFFHYDVLQKGKVKNVRVDFIGYSVISYLITLEIAAVTKEESQVSDTIDGLIEKLIKTRKDFI